MPADPIQFDQSTQAVFTICASADVTAAGMNASAEILGSSFAGEFHSYFSAERRPQFSQALKAATGCVALVDCDADPEQALGTMERLRTMSLRNLSIVAYASHIDATYLLSAMRSGCNEFLVKPADPDILREVLLRFQSQHIAESGGQRIAGRVILFYGSKGGVGTTTVAVHLASTLVLRHRKRTLLIDHHHELGHAALYLGLKEGQYHFDELVRNADRLDANLLHGFVSRHSSGLEVLSSPDACAVDHKSSPEEIQLVLDFLRKQYDYVIIDSSMRYKELVPSLLQGGDEVCIISTPDVAALRDLARRVEHLSMTVGTNGKLRILINRATSDDAVTPDQIQTAVRFPVWLSIPNNYADLVRAINSGEPIPPQHRSGFAQSINKLSEKLLAVNPINVEPTPNAKKPFTFWRSKRLTNA